MRDRDIERHIAGVILRGVKPTTGYSGWPPLRPLVLLSYQCYGTYLAIDFHRTDKDGESHGRCDRMLVMAERYICYGEDYMTGFSGVSGVWKPAVAALA
jgi:hypothetical protein